MKGYMYMVLCQYVVVRKDRLRVKTSLILVFCFVLRNAEMYY